jgi:D-3-phosphoglycerate dehydrogenase / 2-oxoglutarate reductase
VVGWKIATVDTCLIFPCCSPIDRFPMRIATWSTVGPLLSVPMPVIAGVGQRWDAAAVGGAGRLRVVSRTGVGYDNCDVPSLASVGVATCNAPWAPAVSTAEHTIALMMAITKRVVIEHGRAQHGQGTPAVASALELDERTLGIVGLGRIARRVAAVGLALGMRVLAHDPMLDESPIAGVQLVGLDDLFRNADVLTLHAPGGVDTKYLVNARTLGLMPKGSYLVNCARGSLVDQVALLEALERGHLAGAALDVTEPEPLPVGHPLLGRDDVIVTPHVASSTAAGRRRLYEHAIENALAFLDGRPQNVIAP